MYKAFRIEFIFVQPRYESKCFIDKFDPHSRTYEQIKQNPSLLTIELKTEYQPKNSYDSMTRIVTLGKELYINEVMLNFA